VHDISHIIPNVEYVHQPHQTLFQKLLPMPINNNYPKIPIPIKDVEMENIWNEFGEEPAPTYILKYEPIIPLQHEITHDDMTEFEKELYDIWKNTVSDFEYSEEPSSEEIHEIPSYMDESELMKSLQEIENMTENEDYGYILRHQHDTENMERNMMQQQEIQGEFLRNEYEEEQKQLQQKKQEQIRIQQEQKLLELQKKHEHEMKIQQDRINQMNEYSKQFMERIKMSQHEVSGTILRNIQKQEHDAMLLHKKNQENERMLLEQRIRQERKDRVQLWNEQFEKQKQDKEILKQEEIKRKELLRDQSKLAHEERDRVARLAHEERERIAILEQEELLRKVRLSLKDPSARLAEESKYDPFMEQPPPPPPIPTETRQQKYEQNLKRFNMEQLTPLQEANIQYFNKVVEPNHYSVEYNLRTISSNARRNLPDDWDPSQKGIFGAEDELEIPRDFRTRLGDNPVQDFKDLNKVKNGATAMLNLKLAGDNPILKPLTIFGNFLTANASEYERNASIIALCKTLLEIEKLQYKLQKKLAKEGRSSNPADYL
jgi:hypothetical protein